MNVNFESCHAELLEDRLVLGNSLFQREWRVENGLLYPLSFRDLASVVEWLARPAAGPSPYPREPLVDGPDKRAVSLTTRTGRFGPVEAESLVAELILKVEGVAGGPLASMVYRFQIFPQARGVVMSLSGPRPGGAVGQLDEDSSTRESRTGGPVPTGNESDLEVGPDKSLPSADGLELLDMAPLHLRLTQVVLADVTDVHNELVQEHHWLLHPNEAHLALAGNLFVVENTLTGDGLVFLKHAPLPDARAIASGPDLRVQGKRAFSSRLDLKSAEFGPGHPRYPLAFQFGFYGHGTGGLPADGGQGCRYIVLCYSGGKAGRVAALQDYERQLRVYLPSRDGLFLSNTWGDRSQDSRISEPFLAREIESAGKLGVDVVQIDDGWQQGRTLNSAQAGGIWQGFWSANADYWEPHPQRLPNGLGGLSEQVHRLGMQLGLWFCPDSSNDYANWRRDAEKLLDYHRTLGVNYFKLDGVQIDSKSGEANFHFRVEALLTGSGGAAVVDLDVTAGRRPGYFGLAHAGPLFVENRYTDWHGYWPHQTLRNLWKLAGYIDPLRLRMEFLNHARNEKFYAGDPLAPARYRSDYLFATVMFSSPLGWFEVQHLPPAYFEQVAPLVRLWKQHRERIFRGRIYPIGQEPDGTSWTGFASVGADGGYLLIFRELNDQPSWSMELPMFAVVEIATRKPDSKAAGAAWKTTVLAGRGSCRITGGSVTVEIPKAQDFLFVRVDK